MKKIYVCGLIILTFLVGVITGYGVMKYLDNNKVKEQEPNKENKPEIEEEQNDNSLYSKYVIDASYQRDVKYDEYIRHEGESTESQINDFYGIKIEYNDNLQRFKDLKVPYFKMNTTSAKETNKEIEKLYDEYVKYYNYSAEASKDKDTFSCSHVLTYNTYLYSDILSVTIISGGQCTAPWEFDFKTYVFDIKTGERINYSEILNKLNLDKEEINKKLKDLTLKLIIDDYNYDEEYKYYLDEASNILIKSIKDNSINVYVDNNGKLNAFVLPYYPIIQGRESQFYNIKVD